MIFSLNLVFFAFTAIIVAIEAPSTAKPSSPVNPPSPVNPLAKPPEVHYASENRERGRSPPGTLSHGTSSHGTSSHGTSSQETLSKGTLSQGTLSQGPSHLTKVNTIQTH